MLTKQSQIRVVRRSTNYTKFHEKEFVVIRGISWIVRHSNPYNPQTLAGSMRPMAGCLLWCRFYGVGASIRVVPDRFDLIGGTVALVGVSIIMYWPRH